MVSGMRKAAQKTSRTLLSAKKYWIKSRVRINPRRAEIRVATMMTAAAERMEEFSLEMRFLPFWKRRLNIICIGYHRVAGLNTLSYTTHMPLTKSALKKQRVDKRRTTQNIAIRGKVKTAVKSARAGATPETLKSMYSALDRAVKHHLIAKRQASRLKSRIAKARKK